jgi:DeoR family transcriptional regulator, fructose operon transcriptional repressor
MTIRRDLRKLADQGEVRIVRGGVSLPDGSLRVSSFVRRADRNATAKRRIAATALGLVEPNDAIAIDAGTTTYALMEALPETFGGAVVTHSVPVIEYALAHGRSRVIGLGGDLLLESRAFVGPMTVDGASRLRVRTFFVGAAAVDERGIYVSADAERPTKLALMGIADQVVLLVDHTKFSQSAPVLLCDLDALAGVVTDRAPTRAISEQLERRDVALHIADEA